MSSLIKTKTQLTPKITLTKINITKSTPFLIRRHHLDDTEMYSAINAGKKFFTMNKIK